MKLSLGISPCPNDTFIFEALVNGHIDTGEISFEVFLEDVQTLNEWAQQGQLDITKISFGVLPKILDEYTVLQSGGALGMGVGPLLISKFAYPVEQHDKLKQEVEKQVIAIPGENTTAHFLFSQAFPTAKNKVFLRFNEIEEWVAGNNGLGVIIHENRFTYIEKGLHQWADLGELWEVKTGLPIPLGGIVGKKSLGKPLLNQINKHIQKSLSIAWKNYPNIPEYVKTHAQEMNENVIRSHIGLYVNDFSLSMKTGGKKAIMHMLDMMDGKDKFSEEAIFCNENL